MRRVFIALLFVIFSSQFASAQRQQGAAVEEPLWYISLGGSVAFVNDYDMKPVTATDPSFQIENTTGIGLAGTIGYQIMPNIRTEIELAHYRANIENRQNFPVLGGGSNTREASNQATTIMGNVYYDFNDWKPTTRLTPYVGGGIGAMYLKTAILGTLGGETIPYKDWVFAYQLMTGINWDVHTDGAYKSQFYLGYRYIESSEGKATFGAAPNRGYRFNHRAHHADLGYRFYF